MQIEKSSLNLGRVILNIYILFIQRKQLSWIHTHQLLFSHFDMELNYFLNKKNIYLDAENKIKKI